MKEKLLHAREAKRWGKEICLVVSEPTCKYFWIRKITGNRERWYRVSEQALAK